MTGAGLGGYAVALVRADAEQQFSADVATAYEAAAGITPHVYVCMATNGAEVMMRG